MTRQPSQPNRALRRTALVAVYVALLPIAFGAVTTTLKAGMAFADWPTSDGHNMILYPWLQSFRDTDKFVEHGHRLAGVLIGILAIAVAAVAWRTEPRRTVRMMCCVFLLGVIGQGLLGGIRVRWNSPELALVHGLTASLVFALIVLIAVVTARHWQQLDTGREASLPTIGAFAVLAAPAVILVQYALGGFIRHLNTMLTEHQIGAGITSFVVIIAATVLVRSGHRQLRSGGRWLFFLLLLQVALGLLTWIVRFGFQTTGYVAVPNSATQLWIRSAHTVTAMLLLSAAIVSATRLVVLIRAGRVPEWRDTFSSEWLTRPVSSGKGGVA